MNVRNIFLLLLLVLISLTARTQNIKKFTEEPAKFFDELTSFFQDIDNPAQKKVAKKFFEEFTLEWNGGKFSDEQKQEMIKTCNKMLKRKMKPIPHFKNYLSAITSFNNSGQPESSFKAWEASLDKLINKSTSTAYIDYLEISNNLFSENVLYMSGTTRWKSDNNNYIFEFDTIPRIVFPSLNLTCFANDDSSNIYNTKGVYYPTLQKWVGSGGKILWLRAGFDEDTVYADIANYSVNMKQSKYTLDSVHFYNKTYFKKPLLGVVEEKVLAAQTEEKASYPRFDSYDKRIKIEQVFANIDYEGGFSMRGGRIIGAGDATQDANLYFYREGKKFLKTSAKTFIIRKDKISSANSSVTVYWEKDSIYHPGLQMKYLENEKELSLLRDKDGIASTPFFDTYHKLDIYIEALYWKLDQPLIDLKMIKGIGTESEAKFESYNFFEESRFYKLLGIQEQHPLSNLKKYAKKIDTNVVYVPDYANFLKIDVAQVEAQILKLATMGFVAYDIDNNTAFIKEKLNNFLLSKAGKTDYDVIQFNSATKSQSNAILNLLNFDLKLNGVEKVYLSDSQQVVIYPKDRKIVIKKNRDFEFDGLIMAGMFDYWGKLFSFSYEKFKIDMPVIDSMFFYVKSFKPDASGKKQLVKVTSAIEGIKGDLQIDGANNKSGVKSIPKYPLFRSLKDSYVYYDKKSVQNGVYAKDRFYFHVDPFEIDSLDNISTEGISFAGNFVSADIFPDFDEVLKVQPDYSLGFVKLLPASGYQVYKGKGTYDSIVDLSNKGLRGNGTLNYLTSVSKSNSFIFYPDSTNADVRLFTLNEQKSGTEYPPVTGEDVKEHWTPYNDMMVIANKQKPFEMYNSESTLNGALTLTPTSLSGRGIVGFKEAEMEAELFKFKNRTFDSDTADFRLKSFDLTEMAFKTVNYKSHIDFDQRKGEFSSNGGTSMVEFPVNKYICFMDEFEWFMDKEEIELVNTKSQNTEKLKNLTLEELADIDISGSEFVSVHPGQDSLRFFSPRARFNLKDYIIYAKEVKVIKVADAAVFPDKGDVTILKRAEMKTLVNAQIIANTTSKYHLIYDALVNVLSRKNYTASGMYDYRDETKIKHPVYFSKIAVDTTVQTYGTGLISDTSKFVLSPNFDFTGNVKLSASKEFLYFNGGFKINQDCDNLFSNWVKFRSEINPNEIYIPIGDTLTDINNVKLAAGVFVANDSNQVYTAFLSEKFKPADQSAVSAKGYIFFDNENSEYRISNKEKLKQISMPGDYLSLSKGSCIAHGEGKINFAPNLGRVVVDGYGSINHYVIPDQANLNIVMFIDFFFNDGALSLMNTSLLGYNTLDAVDLTLTTFSKTLTEIFGVKDGDKLISEVAMNGVLKKLPAELQHTFFLEDIKMKWDSASSSFLSTGKIGIVALGKSQINRYVNGNIQVIRKRTGDELNIYLEFSPGEWYFFNYKQNVMMAISSNDAFNKIVRETKYENRVLKAEKGLPQYSYSLAPESKKKTFLKKINGE